jgi:hypothetical protein
VEGKPAAETAPQDIGSGNGMLSEILVALEGLSAGSEYCAELVASNASGTSYGGQVRFTTSAALQSAIVGSPISPLPTPSVPPPPASVSVVKMHVAGDSVALTALCENATDTGCEVLEQLTAYVSLRGDKIASANLSARNRRTVTVAQRRFSIASGQAATLALSLNSTGRRLLARSRSLPARLSAILTNSASPQMFASRRITFTRHESKGQRLPK